METGKNCGQAEFHRHILRALLHYHERVMNDRCPGDHGSGCEAMKQTEGRCPKAVFTDVYAEALREAIRCIEIVHKDELSGG